LDFNLSDVGEALIGFKGKFGRYIENLAFYKATRIECNIVKSERKGK
jgi:hypothetical protein